jgi:hypothetical protein
MLKWMMLSAMTFAISGCAVLGAKPEPVAPTIPNACAAFDIIRPSREDTEETKRQVLAHNRVYRITCTSNEEVK